MPLKFLRFLNNTFVLFPITISHSYMSKCIRESIMSAGYLTFNNEGDAITYGKSNSLDIESDASDADFFAEYVSQL